MTQRDRHPYRRHRQHCHRRYQQSQQDYEGRLQGYPFRLFQRDQLRRQRPWYRFPPVEKSHAPIEWVFN